MLKEKTKFKETEIGLIPEEWEVVKLEKVVSITSSKRIFHSDYVLSGVPFYRSKEIIEKQKGNKVTTELYITEQKFNEIKSKFGAPCVGDVLLTSVGTLGIPYIVRELEEFYFKDGNLTWFRNFQKLNSNFLYHFFLSELGRERLNGITIGSTQSALTIAGLKTIQIALPPLLEQKAIAAVLSSLDDKIELLRGQNKTLEAIAQALFKEWFIDFNFPDDNGKPYRKSGGVMIDSELGEIPEGWRVGVLNELMSNILPGEWGKDASDKDYAKEVYCVRGTDLCDIRYGSDLRTPRRFIQQKKFNQVKLRDGDIVIEISGGTEGQSTGRACYINNGILTRLEQDIVAVNFCKTLRPKERCTYWIFMLLNYLYDKGIFFNWENGTTGIKNLALKEFLIQHLIAIPDKQPLDLICRFNEICLLFYKRIQENNKQIDFIKSTRNILLPKLMKGEIRVKNINSNDE